MAITWATVQTITQLTSVVNTEQRSTNLDLTASYLTNIEVIANSDQTTPTDTIIIRIYRSHDNSTFDDEPWQEFSFLPDDTNNYQKSFDVPMCRHIELGVESSGAVDTYVVDASYQRITAI